jgi:hypothetical protein
MTDRAGYAGVTEPGWQERLAFRAAGYGAALRITTDTLAW